MYFHKPESTYSKAPNLPIQAFNLKIDNKPITTLDSSIQSCDTNIKQPSANRYLMYQEIVNNGSRRCEGFYVANVSRRQLRLVSVSKGSIHYSYPDKNNLRTVEQEEIRIFNQSTFQDGHVYLKAIGIPNDLFYQMDGVLSPQDSFIWPIKDKLLKYERTKNHKNIGILGFYHDANKKPIYVPVTLKNNRLGYKFSENIFVKLICASDVEEVYWNFSTKEKTGIIKSEPQEKLAGESFSADVPISISIPASRAGKGLKSLTIQCKIKDRFVPLSFQIYL